MADYRNCPHHVLVKTDVSSLGDLYALAKRRGECWLETHPGGLTFHFARFEAAFFFMNHCVGGKGLEVKYGHTNTDWICPGKAAREDQ
jgi:hypothetical protein